MKSSRHTPSPTTDRPSNSIHRLSEVVPRFQTLKFSSAANQAKTENRRAQFLEQLIKQKYKGEIAKDNITFIRDAFTSFDDKIKLLHKGTSVPIASRKWSDDLGFENGTNSEVDEDIEDEFIDHDYDDNYSERETVFRKLTSQEEEEDEEHWREIVSALPQDTTITNYYVEMGYQMPPTVPEEKPEEQNAQFSLGESESSIQNNPKPKAKKWVPRNLTSTSTYKRLTPPSPSPTNTRSKSKSKSNTAQLQLQPHLHNKNPFLSTENPRNKSRTQASSSPPPPPKRTKNSSPRSGPKPPPRCSSCLKMRKLCDRKSPCGRCAAMRGGRVCVPYWRDV